MGTLQWLYRRAAQVLILFLICGFVWFKFVKDRPRTDSRLLGAWEPAIELTLLNMAEHRDLTPQQQEFWRSTLEDSDIHFYPTYISFRQKQTGQRMPYEVIRKDGDKLTLRVMDGDRPVTYTIVFEEGNQLHWRPLAEGSDVRQYFRRTDSKEDVADNRSPSGPYETLERQMLSSRIQK